MIALLQAVPRNRVLAHESVDDRDAGLAGEPPQLFCRTFAHRAVSGKDDRVAGVRDGFRYCPNRLVVGRGALCPAARNWLSLDIFLGDIFGTFEDIHSGFFLVSDLEGLSEHFRDRFSPFHQARYPPCHNRTTTR